MNEFINEDVWRQLLQLHLKATDQQILRRNPIILEKLGTFACQVVKAVIIAQSNQTNTRVAVKSCDDYTVDLAIPTKFGVVKLLPVRELLTY